jgi:hypothetical protein
MRKVWAEAILNVRVVFEVEGSLPSPGDPKYEMKMEAISNDAISALHEAEQKLNQTLIELRKHRRALVRRGTPPTIPISTLIMPPSLGMEILDVTVERFGLADSKPPPMDEQQQAPAGGDEEARALGAELAAQMKIGVNRPPVEE